MNIEQLTEFSAIYHHRFLVLEYMNLIIADLQKRAQDHDKSKFEEDEFPGLVACADDIRRYAYGTPEYMQMRDKYKRFFDAHYKKNSHHPEHFPNGIEDMTLVDLLEMLCDWKAASMRTESRGNMDNSIKIGTERYNIPPVLVKILENTRKAYNL